MKHSSQLTPSGQDYKALHGQAVRHLQAGQMDQGIALLHKACELNPGSADIHKDLGTAYWQAGQPETAQKHYEKAAKLAPKNAAVLNGLAAFLIEQGSASKAQNFLRRALKIEPRNPEIQNNLGVACHKTGKLPESEECFRSAIQLNPNWANPYFGLGRLLREQKRNEEADQALRQALKINPGHALAWDELGALMLEMQALDDARKCYENVVKYYPQYEPGWLKLLRVVEQKGDLEDAQEFIQKAYSLFPNNLGLIQAEAKIARRQGKLDHAVEILEKTLPTLKQDSYKNAGIFFELGLLYDRTDKVDKAFEAFETANTLFLKKPTVEECDFDFIPDIIKSFKECFIPSWVESWSSPPEYRADQPAPVFLVGFPRSGTTLLEQVLNSHPDVIACEERPVVETIYRDMEERFGKKFPENLNTLTPEDIEHYRDMFFDIHEKYGTDFSQKPVFVDKMPVNMIFAGLIYRMFPNCKFILAIRHPCDCALSCFMQEFEANNAMIHFTRLSETARMYDQYFDLWQHFSNVLPLQVYTHRYEDLVGNFQPSVKALLQFLGVDWDDAVLEYDKTARESQGVHTPSYHQVTEKIYTRASGRWLRYHEHIEPVLDVLAPWAEHFGYAVKEK